VIKATGRGAYQRSRTDASGRVIRLLTREDGQWFPDVKANVQKGKKTGEYFGRAAVRFSGYLNIQAAAGVVQGISHKHCTIIQRADGYGYNLRFLPRLKSGFPRKGGVYERDFHYRH